MDRPGSARTLGLPCQQTPILNCLAKRQALRPFCDKRGFGQKIRNLRRNGLEPRCKRARQAQQRDLAVELFVRAKIVETMHLAPEPAHEPQEIAAAEERHDGSGFRDQRQIAGELKRVAKPLLVEDDELFAYPAFALPFRDRELQFRLRRDPADPAILIALPTLFEIAAKQMQRAFVVLRVGGIGLVRERRIESGVRFDRSGPVPSMRRRGRRARPDRRAQATGPDQTPRARLPGRLSFISTVPRLNSACGEVGLVRERHIERGERRLELAEFLKNDPTIVAEGRHGRGRARALPNRR